MRSILLAAVWAGAVAMPSAMAAEAHFVKQPAIGCYDRGLLTRTRDMREDGRTYDAQTLMQTALASGQCRTIRPGTLVIVEDGDILAGLTKVRAQGEPSAVWVRDDALSSN